MSEVYWYLVLGWGIFYTFHSLLASVFVKKWVENHAPLFHHRYRLWYNLFAVITLALLLAYHYYLPSETFFVSNVLIKAISVALLFSGSTITLMAFKNYNTAEFLGLKAENLQKASLATSGLNRLVRHPLYLGIILLFLGLWLWESSLKNLIALLSLWVYLVIGIYLEEQKLVIYFGEAYKNYQKKVKRLIPWVW